MTLSGKIAALRPDIDMLAPTRVDIAVHQWCADVKGGAKHRESHGPERADVFGTVEPGTGTYQSTANTLTEAQRRGAGLRRNGRPRRQRA